MSSSATETLAEVTMPQMGVSVAEGTITEWRKQPGDWVENDEITRRDLHGQGGDRGAVAGHGAGEGDPDRALEKRWMLGRCSPRSRPRPRRGEAHPDEETSDVRPQTSEARAPATPVSPVVRRIADEHHIDLMMVEGTGRRGRVTKKDIVAFIEAGNGNGKAEKPQPTLHSESPYREEPAPQPTGEGEPLSLMRKQIGEHMVRSLQTAAHCTTIVEADMSAIEAARGKLSYLPLVAKATIAALREYPQLNATLEGDRLVQHEAVHLGIAVALGDDGLIVPVVRNAHELSHEGLASRIIDLAERARSKRLEPDEVGGGTFTITNPGRYGALLATPIINQPQVAILDLEAVTKRAVVVSDEQGRDSIAIRPMTYFCMSWDHRALDGVLAAKFLGAVKRNVEEWRG